MNVIKNSSRINPKVSLILLDWSVRESFHLLHYLERQNVSRDTFEVIIIEYYDTMSRHIKDFERHVDTWIVMGMPRSCYYHKHLMYNVGIVASKGDVVVICDSDAMVKDGFVNSIVSKFNCTKNIVYHIDQFRNMRRDFYPFNYPSFDDVLGNGCINNIGGKTAGVLNTDDPIHARNYGACMCARRSDLIHIGGADEHIDFLGHICGPYDMTFRLSNLGRREIWDHDEFMFHTWHPGQAGTDNYLGPHDGRHMSTTSLETLTSGRVMPLVENGAIRMLRERGESLPWAQVAGSLIDPAYPEAFHIDLVDSKYSHTRFEDYKVAVETYRGYQIVNELGRILAYPPASPHGGEATPLEAEAVATLRELIDSTLPMEPDALLEDGHSAQPAVECHGSPMGTYRGYRMEALGGRILAYPLVSPREGKPSPLEAETLGDARRLIDAAHGHPFSAAIRSAARGYILWGLGRLAWRRAGETARTFGRALRMSAQLLVGPLVTLVACVLSPAFRAKLRQKIRVMLHDDFVHLDGLVDVAAYLALLKAEGHAAEGGKVAVLVESRRAALFLWALARHSPWPAIEIHLASDGLAISRLMEGLSNRKWTGSIIVAEALHARHHAVFRASACNRCILIV